MNKKLIVVCGMHRSGTSAYARGMLVLGACMGESLLPAVEGNNSKGFWEDVDIIGFNDLMLTHIGMNWKSTRSVSAEEVEELNNAGFFEKAVALIQCKSGDHSIYALKDPRISKLGLFWRMVFDGMDREVHYVIVHRNPLSVAESLRKRDGIDKSHAMHLWTDYMLGASKLVESRSTYMADYDALMNEPTAAIKGIANAFRLTIDAEALQSYTRAFLDKNLRHTLYGVDALVNDPDVSALVKSIYKRHFKSISRNANDAITITQEVLTAYQDWHNTLNAETESRRRESQRIVELNAELHKLRTQLMQAKDAIIPLNEALNAAEIRRKSETNALRKSMSWRITAPLRHACDICWNTLGIKWVLGLYGYIKGIIKAEGGSYAVLKVTYRILRTEGLKSIYYRVRNGTQQLTRRRSVLSSSDLGVIKSSECGPYSGGDKRIAIHIHAYYVDLMPSILRYVENLPKNCVLYISVTSTEAKIAVQALLQRMNGKFESYVRIVPNRGRDIGPFLCEFCDEWLKYDYVAHIHTKKSLYTGAEQVEWREYLLQSLLGSERAISRNLSVLENHSSIGFLYPETYPGLPYWAHTWLGNREIGARLALRMGISLEGQRYIDAPMGSMFWCKAVALAPLLGLKLKFSDFPEELGQTDGTLAHAVERLFPQVVNLSGYNYALIQGHEEKESTFLRHGGMNLYQYVSLRERFERILQCQAIELLTVDIFDTVLVRGWLYPTGVMSYLSDIVKDRYGISDFSRVRDGAERAIRNRVDFRDPSIDDIYREVAITLKSQVLADDIKSIEIEIERRSCFVAADVVDMLRQLATQNIRLSFVSDMYLTPDIIRNMLGGLIEELGADLHVSCDVNARKDNGTMWNVLRNKYGVECERWIHVGDNEHSDIQIPLDAKRAMPIHIMSHVDQYLRIFGRCESFLAEQSWSEVLMHGLIAKKLILDGNYQGKSKIDLVNQKVEVSDLSTFGYAVIGPVLTTFMCWLISKANSDGVNCLLYASREGFLLEKAHRIISASSISEIGSIPRGRYLLTSRVIANLVAIDGGSGFESVMSAHYVGSFLEFLNGRLGIWEYGPYIDRIGEEQCSRTLSLSGQRSELLLMLTACGDLIRAHSRNQSAMYKDYIENLAEGNPFAIVDIGYAGSIQRQLSSLSSLLDRGYYFVTTASNRNRNDEPQIKMNACFAENLSPVSQDVGVYKYHLILESILTSPDEQFCRFDSPGVPEYRDTGGTVRDFSSVEKVQEGALDYMRDVISMIPEIFLSFKDARDAANLALTAFGEGVISLVGAPELFEVEDFYSGNRCLSVLEHYRKSVSTVME